MDFLGFPYNRTMTILEQWISHQNIIRQNPSSIKLSKIVTVHVPGYTMETYSPDYLISVKNDVIMTYFTIISVILFIQKISYSQEQC